MGRISGLEQYLNSDAGGGHAVEAGEHGARLLLDENGEFQDAASKDGIQVGQYEMGREEDVENGVGGGVGGSGRH